MPTTTYVDFAHSVYGIGSRTDSVGGAVSDVTAEDLRLALPGFSEGAVDDAAFLTAVSSGMGLTVGSGSAKADRFVVAGEVAGQQAYTVRLDAVPVAVTVPAAEPASTRTDEIYLVVLDAAYDGNALGTASAPLRLPRLGYRKGDAGGAAPGVDSLWKASALLATVTVGAAVTSITAANVVDARTYSYAPSPVPAGTVIASAVTSAPAGWLLCNGATVSRTTYRRLFRAIGTAFGVGDGSTTFALPDARDRFLVGAGSTYGVGSTGGAASVTLTEAQMPSHGHTASSGSGGVHNHAVAATGPDGSFNDAALMNEAQFTGSLSTGDGGSHSHSVTVNPTGGGGSHENRPPYLGMTALIKT